VSAETRWLPWLRFHPGIADSNLADRVWVPAVDALAILDELGAETLRGGLVALLDDAAPLPRGGDDQSGDRHD
jgi:hypothetical protein